MEAHYLTITSEVIDPDSEEYGLGYTKPSNFIEVNINDIKPTESVAQKEDPPPLAKKPSKKDDKPSKQKLPSVPKPAHKVIQTIKYAKVVPVRLKSSEEIKIPIDILKELRMRAHNRTLKSLKTNDISSFSDRLGPALKRLSTTKRAFFSPLQPINGVIKPKNNPIPLQSSTKNNLKLRAALDKTTVAWSSATKKRPKASLLDQLTAVISETGVKNSTDIHPAIPPANKNLPQNHKPSLVPLVIKLQGHAKNSTAKMLPLSTALKIISTEPKKISEGTKLFNGSDTESTIKSTFQIIR